MNTPRGSWIIATLALLAGCVSSMSPIGETFSHWKRHTLIADLVYAEGNVKAYRSGSAVYYFRDDVLFRVDEGVSRHEIELTVRQSQASGATNGTAK